MKLRNIFAFLFLLVVGVQHVKAQTSYDLWIAGIQVTSSNMNDLAELVAELDDEAMERFLEGEMEITFDEGSNTLTLHNAIIRPAKGVVGIISQMPDLNISLTGRNTIDVDESYGVELRETDYEDYNTTFLGGGILNITSNYYPFCSYSNIVLKGGVEVTSESTSSTASGLLGRQVHRKYPTLTLQGRRTMLKVKGGSDGSLTCFSSLNLSDGLAIVEPTGATFAEIKGVVVGNSCVANEWVIIAQPETEAYACYTPENTTLTFYYDNQRQSREGTTYDLNTLSNNPGWNTDGTNANVTKVVFDPSFADARPTTTFSWFNKMKKLQTITGMEYLNTSEVTNMSWMFGYCSSLTSLDLSKFNTANVGQMTDMFISCHGLTSLDLSNFNTSNVTDMYEMFYGCIALTTIYVGEGWSTAAVTDSWDMFYGCKKLVGGAGTTYDENYVDASYAHVDGDPSNPGYFSEKGPEAYACYTPENTTLTFYYDTQRQSREGTTYDLKEEGFPPRWSVYEDATCFEVTAVVFDSSFADARPTATDHWLAGMNNLQSITGIANLNTSEVTSMRGMFQGIPLTDIDLTGFNTSKVTRMSSMFGSCTQFESLDLSSFNTSNVTDMYEMFYGCKELTTIYVGEGWSSAAVTDSEDMFYGCKKLVGGTGTTYDANHVDASYAHIDGGADNPGYFTANSNIKGDLNGDGQVTIADGVAVLNAMAGESVSGNADLNGDGQVTIADVVAVLNLMAEQ
ncbi:MAG: BspA family leucine-rich repeat surface protein [Bacteroidaceae bacterium]|nr:BspA family leucine-rich repeat surface protein [Bacteroidaceae bacterium]